MAFLLKHPFKIVSFNSSVNLLHLHLHEIRAIAVLAAEVEESSSNKHQLESQSAPNRASVALMPPPNNGVDFNFRAPRRLYSASANEEGSSESVGPENVIVIPITDAGPTRGHAVKESLKIRLDLGLNSCHISKRKLYRFEIQAAADDGDENHGDSAQIPANYIPDLNLSPPDLTWPVTEFVREIKSQNVSRFIDYVRWYLGEHIGREAVAEYDKIRCCLTNTQLANLDTIKIWNTLTVHREIEKALVNEGLIETPHRFADRPSLQKQLRPEPTPGYKASNNEILSDARYCATRAGDLQSIKAKRKKPCLYDFMGIKKRRHGAGLRIDEAKALARDKAPGDLPSDSDSDSDSD